MMLKFCKDHILDPNIARMDLSFWLKDMFKTYDFPYCVDPKIIMGDKTFEIFQSITQEIIVTMDGARIYRLEKTEIPQRWITIDPNVDPYYIRITWEESKNDGLCIKNMFIDDSIAYSTFFGDRRTVPRIKKVIYNNPATIIFWSDHTKTVVQCQKGDDYDPEKGLVMAIAKKALGNTSRKLNDVLHKWEKEAE